jgi:dolichol kinase
MRLVERLGSEGLLRKSIHMLGFAVPFVVMKLGTNLVVVMIGAVTILYLTSETLRLKGRSLPAITEFTKKAARPEELSSYILPPLYFALGFVVSLLIFPQPIGFAAIAVLTLGDGTSNIVGSFGQKRLPFNSRKTLEGTISGFLLGFLGAAVFVPPLSALLGAAVGSLMEALPLPINDNLTVPVSSGLAMSILL